MKIYNVMWSDSHKDPTSKPFKDFDDALSYAKEFAASVCNHPEDLQESKIDGFLFHIRYSFEGDCIWITEHEI